MLTVHHLGVSQSERIVWLCEELGIPYELKLYDRDSVTRLAPANYKALHPMETAPIITDGDVVLGESAAIIDYIIGKYGQGRLTVGPDQPNYADYLYWYHFANGSGIPNEMSLMIANAVPPGNPIVELLKARGERGYAMMEKRLGEVPYFAGNDLTAADIILVFNLTTMRAFSGRQIGTYPNILKYLARVAERPAYQAAMKKGDPTMPPLLT